MKKLSKNMVSTAKILNDLKYHNGDEIGQQLNISRAAIWKIIKKLENYGIEISSIKGKGYGLINNLILLDEQHIIEKINDKNMVIEVFETIDSTNNYLKNKLCSKPQACIAEHQSLPRGRLNNKIDSPFGQNLYFSYSHNFKKDVAELAGINLIVNLSIIKALQTLNLPDKLYIKWPSDIMYQEKKLSGCLIDIIAESNGTSQCIIGIGINSNYYNYQVKDNGQEYCSLQSILGSYVDRNNIAILIIKHLTEYIDRFDDKGFADFIEEWNEVDYLIGKTIKLVSGSHAYYGKYLGINSLGNLILEIPNKGNSIISSGYAEPINVF
jgi:BirA family transcriptional regulator, biotin operon repressor / biotin---[acetyl-CoA-carboxylase] ligase